MSWTRAQVAALVDHTLLKPEATAAQIRACAELGCDIVRLAVPDADRDWLAFLGAALLGVLANAAATGGLSGVFPRYQARIAWLLPVGALLLLLPALPRRPGT